MFAEKPPPYRAARRWILAYCLCAALIALVWGGLSIWEKVEQSKRETRAAYCKHAYGFFLWKDYDRAICLLTEALKIEPNDPRALIDRGVVWYAKQDNDRAIADYNAALKLKSGFASEAFNNLGNAWIAKKNYDRAIESLNQALKRKPDYAEAFANLGNAWDGKRDYDRAIDNYNKAIKLDPNSTFFYLRAIAWLHKDQKARAITDFQRAYALAPRGPHSVEAPLAGLRELGVKNPWPSPDEAFR
jgi:tetratricopeptide (TPR) repeat protein